MLGVSLGLNGDMIPKNNPRAWKLRTALRPGIIHNSFPARHLARPKPQVPLTTLSLSNGISLIPSFVTTLTIKPLKSIGNLLFSSSAQRLRSSRPRSRSMSGWWCLSRRERQ